MRKEKELEHRVCSSYPRCYDCSGQDRCYTFNEGQPVYCEKHDRYYLEENKGCFKCREENQ